MSNLSFNAKIEPNTQANLVKLTFRVDEIAKLENFLKGIDKIPNLEYLSIDFNASNVTVKLSQMS